MHLSRVRLILAVLGDRLLLACSDSAVPGDDDPDLGTAQGVALSQAACEPLHAVRPGAGSRDLAVGRKSLSTTPPLLTVPHAVDLDHGRRREAHRSGR